MATFAIAEDQRFAIEGTIQERSTFDLSEIQDETTFGGLNGTIDATIDGVQTIAVFDGETVANQESVEMSFVLDDLPDTTVVVRYFVE